MKCSKCEFEEKFDKTDIRSHFVLNSKIDICNDCWLKLTKKELEKLRISDWRKR